MLNEIFEDCLVLLIYLKTYINEEQNTPPMPEQPLTIAVFATLQDEALRNGKLSE